MKAALNVVVGLRPGSAHAAKAEAAGLKVMGIEEAAEAGDVVMILTPDELQASASTKNQIEKHMKEGNVLHVCPWIQHPLQPDTAGCRTWTLSWSLLRALATL